MSSSLKLKKGLDIRLKGGAEKVLVSDMQSELYAVKPIDFPGLTPKLDVRPGDKVLAGTPVFHDKTVRRYSLHHQLAVKFAL